MSAPASPTGVLLLLFFLRQPKQNGKRADEDDMANIQLAPAIISKSAVKTTMTARFWLVSVSALCVAHAVLPKNKAWTDSGAQCTDWDSSTSCNGERPCSGTVDWKSQCGTA